MEEKCRSPLNPSCGRRDIAVYIVYGGRKLPICKGCWEQIADTDLEWGEGVSEAKMKRQAKEVLKAILERAEREAAEKAAREFLRSFKREAKAKK